MEENIFEFGFQSQLPLTEMLKKLQATPFTGLTWSTRESEYEGIYIAGRRKIATDTEIKIRIMDYTKPENTNPLLQYALEVYFPLNTQLQSIMSKKEKKAFLENVVQQIIKTLTSANSSAG